MKNQATLTRLLSTAVTVGVLASTAQAFASAPGQTEKQLVDAELEALYRVTSHFQRLDNGIAEGWAIPFGGCMENPGVGGMGFHFGHLDNYLDGQAVLTRPEVLVYEPTANGGLRLVAVEYTVPVFLWTEASPPRLFGRDFHLSPGGDDWILHVWLYKNNPRGMFEDWNPNVNCDSAP